MCTYVHILMYVFIFKACSNTTQVVNSNIIICNGINDCADGSDEIDCCKNIRVCVYTYTYVHTCTCIRVKNIFLNLKCKEANT